MSHFTRVRTKLRNIATVQRALEDLGYQVKAEDKVRGYGGDRARADLVVRLDGNYDIGFTQQRNGDVVMVADLWALRIDKNAFLNEVTQRYAYHTVMGQAEAQGFQVTEEANQQDGSIRLVMQRWV